MFNCSDVGWVPRVRAFCGGRKRVRTEELTFVQVSAPPLEMQTVCFMEKEPDATISGWRACGFNTWPQCDALEAGVVELMKHDLESSSLAVVRAVCHLSSKG